MGDENRIHIAGLGPGDVALLRNVADEAAEKTVRRWLVAMGLDPDKPIEAQHSFAMLREKASDPEFAADLDWTRRTRKRSEGIIGKAILTAVAFAVVTGCQSAVAWANKLLTIASVK